jgi:hypothetical protein
MSEEIPISAGVLRIPPQIYREYAAEFKEMARTSGNDEQRSLYLRVMHIWLEAADRFELSESYFRSLQNSAA